MTMYFIFIAILGILLIFVATTVGSACVFFLKKEIGETLNSIILGFAGGIMFSACIWGLLSPAIEQVSDGGIVGFLPVIIGFVLGAAVLVLTDRLCPILFKSKVPCEKLTKNHISFLVAITLHNMPEGLIVGLAFGNAIATSSSAMLISAIVLAIGVAVQNVPEGMAVSFPLGKDVGKKKAFLYGVLSGAVEPLFAILGLIMATQLAFLMPWFLSFAAGIMVFVTVDEIIPEAKFSNSGHYGGCWFVIGFVLMMFLEFVLAA